MPQGRPHFPCFPASLFRCSPFARWFLGQQPVEIALSNFPRFFVESPESRILRSLMDFPVYPLFELCFRQIKHAI
jgi:hypothetical protein